MTLYICSYCNRLAVTLWPVTLDGKTLEVCWTCIEEAAERSRAEVAVATVTGEALIVSTISKVTVNP